MKKFLVFVLVLCLLAPSAFASVGFKKAGGAQNQVADIDCYPTTACSVTAGVGKIDGRIAAVTSGTIAGATINSSVIGGSTPAAGSFTTVNASGLTTTAGVSTSDNLTSTVAAKGLVLKQGANGLVGTFTANGTTPVSVATTAIAVSDAIIISLNTVGGTVGVQPHVATITAATGFTVVCTASDTSVYNYAIIKNAA